ncbi:hypothetical protein ACIKT0_01620 [Hansschlegelia beijingensis]|uniref:hypothetical protein n=1 Tax=Hansschlegelia beijingensis TaxID=1133344 RepID=UPI00387F2753
MADPITKDVIRDVVTKAAASSASPAEVAREVLSEPTIAKATRPISRVASETLQGITAAGIAQVLSLTGATKSLVIIAGWFGQSWNADEVSTVLTTVLTVAGLAWAWYGRETTTRPLA